MIPRKPTLALLWSIAAQFLQTVATGLPPTGTGSAYASQCNAAKQSWRTAQGSTFVSEATYNSTITGFGATTSVTTKTYLSSDDTPYTLCDGYPRINGSRTITTSTSSTPYTSVIQTSSSVYRSLSQPQCSIGPSDCARLQQSYKSGLAVYSSYLSRYNSESAESTPMPEITQPPYPEPPICGSATPESQTSALEQPVCAMQDASVKLLYWPVTQASSCDPCHRGSCPTTTLGPTITGQPNTFKTLNTTLTSPTVYIEFMGSWAFTSAGTTFSSPQTFIIAQEPEAVSSHCGKPGGGYGPPQKINYANFNYPVPADVYRCQPSCFVEPQLYSYANMTATYTYSLETTTETATVTRQSLISEAASNLCSTIWNDYAPVLSIPEAFKTIQPAGFQPPGSPYGDDNPCNFIFNEDAVLFDPPLALTKAAQEAKPTLPNANSAYPTSVEANPTAEPVRASEPKATALPESLGLTVPGDRPVATIYTNPNAQGQLEGSGDQGHPDESGDRGHSDGTGDSSHAIGDVIASVLGMTSKGHGQDQYNGKLTLAMASDGSAIVINEITTAVPAHAPEATDATNTANGGGSADESNPQTGMITVDGNALGYTSSDGTLVVGDQTLTRGGSVVVTIATTKTSSSHRTTQRQSTGSGSQAAATASTTSGASKPIYHALFLAMATLASMLLLMA